jgi:hypothetical protein
MQTIAINTQARTARFSVVERRLSSGMKVRRPGDM